MIKINANAKINLTLDILGKRADGYHEVKMIMQEIDLFDLIDIRRDTLNGGINILSDIPGLEMEKNLAYKAAKLLVDKFAIKDGVAIELVKRIPIAAGLAGGSADAAGVIVGMNEEFDLKLTEKEMCELGAQIGSDVPFCICGGTMLAEGRGERLTRLPDMPACYIVLAKPQVEVSTAWAYSEYDKVETAVHPNTDAAIAALKEKNLEKISDNLCNVLESVTEKKYREITMLKEVMLHEGALSCMMSGSGPTVFGIARDKETAERIAAKLENFDEVRVVVTKTVGKE